MTISKKPVPQRATDRRKRDSSTRELLLQVTVDQLNIGGEAEIRLESILAEADCSPSSLYHHFGNLRGLLDEAQLVRFTRMLAMRTDVFIRGAQEITGRDAMISFCSQVIDELMVGDGPEARSRRVNALGSTYKRPDFAKRMAQAQAESSDALAAALRVPQLRGLINQSLDLYAFAHWVQGVIFSRSLVELGGDEDLGRQWNAITKATILNTMFGPDAVSGQS